MDDTQNHEDTQKPLESVRHVGLMGRSIEILQARQSKIQGTQNETQAKSGSAEKMKMIDSIEGSCEAGENYKANKNDTPIVFKNGVYTIRNDLETSSVKMDPALKALVDSVCR